MNGGSKVGPVAISYPLMPAKRNTQPTDASSSTIGFEAKLWLAADKLRNNMDAAEYKHVVLGLIFLKYISDTFEEHRAKLVAGKGTYEGANPEDQDEYKAENVFWVPKEGPSTGVEVNTSHPFVTRNSSFPWLAVMNIALAA